MDHLFFLLIVLLLPHVHEAFTTITTTCNRECGGTTFPYPFGFSPGCPIALSCDASAAVPIIPYRGDNGISYRVISFNSTASTAIVDVPPSCIRSVSDARSALSGANYGVSSRTGMFLRGGCNMSMVSSCTMPSSVISGLLRTAQCDAKDNSTSAACVTSPAPDEVVSFLRWEKVENMLCEDMLTSTLLVDTVEGPSMEFGMAELLWWVNGTCTGGDPGTQCVANATCSDVDTPSGESGHRCTCGAGMKGDGYTAGDGCYVGEHCFHTNLVAFPD
jgi:interleukin-1 receptor-associated kinase 1